MTTELAHQLANRAPVATTPQEWIWFLALTTTFMLLWFIAPRHIATWHCRQQLAKSRAFRSRWQHLPLWQIPHDELAAEATRCKNILRALEKRHSSKTKQPTRSELAEQIAWYRTSLDAVQQSMAYAAAQDHWPQQPPR